MKRTFPPSERAGAAYGIVRELQDGLVARLEAFARSQGVGEDFEPVSWLRDGGRHGGGRRFARGDDAAFDRATANESVVHYDDLPDKRLASATALSCIVHPRHPHVPSMHMHISWTELRQGEGTWRIMADLNPSIVHEALAERFREALRDAAGALYGAAAAQGDRYFFIPALGRHRGVVHFYLEGWSTSDEAADRAFARQMGHAAIEAYGEILDEAVARWPDVDEADRVAQRAYHTLYVFQVLTLDRGTTSGLLVHDQNDVGILGSLPSHVDRALLASWASKVPEPQDQLVAALVEALPEADPCPIDEDTKARLAQVVRRHYRRHPGALALQARGDVLPPTVANHR